MRKKLTALLLACLLLVCLVLPVSAADAPALYGTANAADGTVTVTLSLRGGSAVRSGAFTLSYDSSLTLTRPKRVCRLQWQTQRRRERSSAIGSAAQPRPIRPC